jgi:hypothetical protein
MNRTVFNLILPFLSSLLIFSLLPGCSEIPSERRSGGFPVLEGDYLGQPLPGMEPEIFARGIISDPMQNRDVAISPSGDEMYFGLASTGILTIIYSKRVDGRWTAPEVAPFATDPNVYCFEPCISPGGEIFMFLSNRTPAGKEPRGGWTYQNIWAMDRREGGWSEPYDLGAPVNTDAAEFFPSLTNDGTLYFTRGAGGEYYVYRSRLTDKGYAEPERLGPGVNAGTSQYNAFIAHDESYLIYLVTGSEENIGVADYYISFRNEDDTWTGPINMGGKINRPGARGASPYVTRDGRYFFVSSTRPLGEGVTLTYDLIRNLYYEPQNGAGDIYWVDASFIQKLRPE